MLFVLGTIFSRLYPNYIAAVDIHLENVANTAVNASLSELTKNGEETSFETVLRDNDGKIISIGANTYRMNLLRAEYTKLLSEKIHSISYIEIPLGSLLKKEFFSGYGPRLKIKTISNGVIKTDFSEEVVSCGINRVNHKIFLEVSVSFYAVSATMHRGKTITAQIPIIDTVISGDVPNYYGGFSAAIKAE